MSITGFDPLLSVITSLNAATRTNTPTGTGTTSPGDTTKVSESALVVGQVFPIPGRQSPVTTTAAVAKKKKKQSHVAPSAIDAAPCEWTKDESAQLNISVNVHKSKNWKKIVVAVNAVRNDPNQQKVRQWCDGLCSPPPFSFSSFVLLICSNKRILLVVCLFFCFVFSLFFLFFFFFSSLSSTILFFILHSSFN